jgi:hypothetical protein
MNLNHCQPFRVSLPGHYGSSAVVNRAGRDVCRRPSEPLPGLKSGVFWHYVIKSVISDSSPPKSVLSVPDETAVLPPRDERRSMRQLAAVNRTQRHRAD